MIEKVSVAVVWAFVATTVFADIKLLEPAQDATVSQHTPMQARLVGETIAERGKYFDGGVNAKELKAAGSKPKEILLKWQGGNAPYKVELRRLPDGKVFFSQTVNKTEAIVDSLEIAREWEWSVASAGETVRGRFKTQDSAPRLIKINGAVNARDLGGWIGLDGRRIRQGLIFRTAGLNRNAPIEYYSVAEIKKLHAEGKLAGMGPEGKKHSWQLDSGEKLTEKDMRLIKRSCYAPGKKTLSEDECSRLRLLYGFRTDIDLRRPDEVYGMTGSPLGAYVNWVNIPLMRGYGGFVKEEFFEEKRKIFRVIFDRKAYPIVFHCIAGADRTGTIAFMIEALLGADENTLTLDYLVTGLAAGVT
ncbi:MAG: tyrosine-protein phosphatase, partial [Kiritimatiellae bacterium]|nr:tyrosine-protein phosphatase [Kiritimatiellia bacterium]